MSLIKNFVTAFTLCFISSSASFASTQAMTPDEAKAFYKEAFAHTVENMRATKADYARYFAKDFVMYMNGERYNFDDYIQFMLNIRKDTVSVQIMFKDMMAEANGVATIHTTHISKKDGSETYLNVLSFFRIENQQFISGNELTKVSQLS